MTIWCRIIWSKRPSQTSAVATATTITNIRHQLVQLVLLAIIAGTKQIETTQIHGGHTSGTNGITTDDNTQCPSFTDNSACPCYKFEDGKLIHLLD